MVEIRGKKYKLLEIIKKSQFPQQDLYVCLSQWGYKECFLGYDISHPKIDNIHTHSRAWTIEELENIREKVKQGATAKEIKENFVNPRRTELAIEHAFYKIKKEEMDN